MSELLPITKDWTDALCMAKREFPRVGQNASFVGSRPVEVGALCTRPKGHRGDHRMDAPAFPRVTWKRGQS